MQEEFAVLFGQLQERQVSEERQQQEELSEERSVVYEGCRVLLGSVPSTSLPARQGQQRRRRRGQLQKVRPELLSQFPVLQSRLPQRAVQRRRRRRRRQHEEELQKGGPDVSTRRRLLQQQQEHLPDSQRREEVPQVQFERIELHGQPELLPGFAVQGRKVHVRNADVE